MRRCAALVVASILTANKSRDYSVMGSSAERVLQEGVLCKKMWYTLYLHARACKDSDCNVPQCRKVKEYIRRSQEQSDSRRRAAVNKMMRQRASCNTCGRRRGPST